MSRKKQAEFDEILGLAALATIKLLRTSFVQHAAPKSDKKLSFNYDTNVEVAESSADRFIGFFGFSATAKLKKKVMVEITANYLVAIAPFTTLAKLDAQSFADKFCKYILMQNFRALYDSIITQAGLSLSPLPKFSNTIDPADERTTLD